MPQKFKSSYGMPGHVAAKTTFVKNGMVRASSPMQARVKTSAPKGANSGGSAKYT